MIEMASKLVVHGFGGARGSGCSSSVTQLRLGVVSGTTGLTVVVVVVVGGGGGSGGCLGLSGTIGLSGGLGFTPAQSQTIANIK